MGFFDGIVSNVSSTISNTISGNLNNAARNAAQDAANKATSAETYAGLNVKGFLDKTMFVKKDDGSYEVYYDKMLIGTISSYDIQDIKSISMDIGKAKLMALFGNMKAEFKNQSVGQELAKKFLAQMD